MDGILTMVPDRWRDVVQQVLAPIAWVPRLQQVLLSFFADSPSVWVMAVKYALLLLPAILALAAIWCTGLIAYSLPFRSGRRRLVSQVLLAWWDAARMVWMFWIAIVWLLVVAVGWALGVVTLCVRVAAGVVRDVLAAPLAIARRTIRAASEDGVPWIAVAMVTGWCAVEAAVFTYTLAPTVSDLLADAVGSDKVTRLVGPVLYLLLLAVVAGSFACAQALTDAVRRRDVGIVAGTIVVQAFAMLLEAAFLYRAVVEALLPWIPDDRGLTVLLGAFAWIGVRGATWMLFGRYGTPPLLSVIARETALPADATRPSAAGARERPRVAAADFRRDIEALHARGGAVVEVAALPVLQLLAAALNFAMILVAARPAFRLPFASLEEVTEMRGRLDPAGEAEPFPQVRAAAR